MSSSPGSREVAHRLFAAEFDDADHSYSESDEERAPNYVVTPTGARVNRLFFVGVLTETERVNEDMLRARVVDPTGAFVAYAGQYQPDELAFLERVESPSFLAVTGKARTFQPEDSDRVYTSARPESISRVDAETRDRWVVQAAERTLDRVRVLASAIESGHRGDALEAALVEAGVDASLAQGAALALDHYGTTPAYLAEQRDLAVQAVETVTGDRDEVDRPSLAPDEGDGDAASLAEPDLVDALAAAEVDVEAAADEEPSAAAESTDAEPDETDSAAPPEETTEAESEVEPAADPGSEVGSAADPESEVDAGARDEAEPEPVEATADAEASAEPAGEADAAEGDDLGDFEPGEFDADDVDEEDLDDALTDEERQEVEDNFDTDFSTGNELDEADADPVADEPEEADRQADAEQASPGEPDAEVAPASEEDPEAQFDEEPEPSGDLDTGVAADAAEGDAGGVDLEAAVLDAMSELDDGDGADHDAVVAAVVDEHAVAVDDAEAAIEDALMSGQCYEPADGKLKPI